MAESQPERYRLEREIGEGGMGKVWLATDTRLDRPVAVKAPRLSGRPVRPIHREYLLREARIHASLNHPNIATLYDYFIDEGENRFYLVMEYVGGKSVSKVIRDQRGESLPLDIILEIAMGVLQALSYAHRQGVVHRDVKPGNVVIADEVKLLDFGLANVQSLLESGTGFMAGTPAYMAPEQIEGRPTVGRADLYGLGVTLFEMMTLGRLPFEYTTEDEMLEAHLYATPPPVSQFVPDVPLVLEYTVTRLLAKDPADRYPSAEALLNVLSSVHARLKFSKPHLQLLEHDPTAFIGRAPELEKIEALWEEVQTSGRPRLLAIGGEMGIGKRKLAAEFLRHIVDQGSVALVGRCDGFGVPYTPFAQVLATVFSTESLKSPLLPEQLEQLLDQVPGLAPFLDIPSAALSRGPIQTPRKTQWPFFETVLAVLGQVGPAVIFLEDASLLDKASLALTRYLVQRGRGLPLLIIAACRDDGAGVPWLSAFRSDEREVITLQALSESAVKEYLTHLLEGPVSGTVARAMYQQSGGVPFNVEAIAGQMVEAGELYRSETGAWQYRPAEEVEPSGPPHNLPASLTPFIGRENELAEIADCLQDPACRLLTLVGPGGCGKTRLALEAGAARLADYPHGVFCVSLAPLDSAEAIVPTVAEALGFSFYEGVEPRQQLLDYLRQKSLLLIMDNYEHLLDGVDLVAEILKTAPEVKILATSRARLNVGGEHRFQVSGMAFSKLTPAAPADAAQYSAVKLFLQGAQRALPGFELNDRNLSGVVQVCRLVEGMPLGVRLAAAWVAMLSPEEIATEIGQSLDFLATDLRDVPQRQRSIRATFDHSWNLLTEREREVFQALSVFRGGFAWGAAQRVTGASLRELMALVFKTLLQRTPAPSAPLGTGRTGGRYEVHELLRGYAAEKLEQSPAADEAAHDRHCAYYTAALQGWTADLKGPRQRTALVEMDVEVDNARAAWNWAVERGEVERLDQMIGGLCPFFDRRGRYREGEAACRLAAEKLATVGSGVGSTVLVRILTWMGDFRQVTGQYDEALQSYAQARAISQPQLDESEEFRKRFADLCRETASIHERRSDYAIAFNWLRDGLTALDGMEVIEAARIYLLGADIYHRQGNNTEALLWCQRSLAITENLEGRDKQSVTAHAHNLLGLIHYHLGDFARTIEFCQRSRYIYEQIEDVRGVGRAHINLANGYFGLGDWPSASEHYLRALEILRKIGDVYHQAMITLNLSGVCLNQGDLDQATNYNRQSLEMWQELGSTYAIALLHNNMGAVALRRGDLDEAMSLLQESLTLFQQIDSADFLPEVYRHLAEAYLARRGLDKAVECAQRSLTLAQDQEMRLEEGATRRVLGQVHLALQEFTRAERELQASLRILREMNSRYEVGRTLFQLGLLFREQKRGPEADAALTRAIAIFQALGAHLDLAQAQSLQLSS